GPPKPFQAMQELKNIHYLQKHKTKGGTVGNPRNLNALVDKGDYFPRQEEETASIISRIHPKLGDYKFDKVEDCYEDLLRNHVPKETAVVTSPLSKSSLETLKCVSILVSWSQKDKNEDVNSTPLFATLLCRLIYGIHGTRLERRAERVLHTILGQFDDFSRLLKVLEKVDKNLVCLSMVYNWLMFSSKKKGKEDVFNEARTSTMADLYIKEFLMTKVPKEEWIQEKVSAYLLPCIKGAADTILSSISKALLRSPETAIEVVGFTLAGMKPQLSDELAKEMAKKIGPFLGSENEKLREQAYFTSQSLFRHGPGALVEFLELVSPTARGTKSALTSAGKIHVLKLIKSLEVGSEQAGLVIEKCVKVLENDVHEGTLLECMEVIGCWSKGLDPSSPASGSLSTFIINGLKSMKAPPLRLALCRMIAQLFSTGSSQIHQRFLPEIQKSIISSIDKALAQPSLVHNLAEAVSLSVVLISSASSSSIRIEDSICSQLSKMGNHLDSKFLGSCAPSVHLHAAMVLDFLIKNEMGERSSAYYHALVLCLCCPDREIRQKIKEIITETLRKTSTARRGILDGIHAVVKMPEVSPLLKEEMLTYFSKCCSSTNQEDLKALALDLLVPCHEFEPENKKNLWIFCLKKKLRISPKDLLENGSEEFLLNNFVKGFDSKCATKRRILRTLLGVYGGRIMGDVVATAVEILKDPSFLSVSKDDYLIFRTPEGQLYNQEVGGGFGGGDSGSQTNLKRESKVYSFKEQLEELQLRKELEEKRKAEGKQVKYTPKQMEAIKIQLGKESAIRAQVEQLNSKINNGIDVLKLALEEDQENFEFYIKNFSEELISLMKSPVGAVPAVSFWIQMGKTLFSKGSWIGEALAQVSLRQIHPACDLDRNWGEIEPKESVEKILNRVENLEGISNAALSFCYPFFVMAFQHFPKNGKIISSILQIIEKFSSTGLNDADTIPRAKITNFLYGILEKNSTPLAVSTLVSFCKTAQLKNGAEIVFLEPLELDRHLDALKSPVSLSRETSLTCLQFLCENDLDWIASQEKDLLIHLSGSVYRSQFDPVARISEKAKKIQELLVKTLPQEFPTLCSGLQEDILYPVEAVRISASKAIGFLFVNNKNELESLFQYLKTKYDERSELIPPVVDDLGRILKDEVDSWEARSGIGLTMTNIAPLFRPKQAEEGFKWIVTRGLGDRSQKCQGIMLDAALEMVKAHGLPCLHEFISIVEEILEKAEKSEKFDKIREGAVILMGSLAKYLDSSSPENRGKVKGIFSTLLETLQTPSETVQGAVANCLPELMCGAIKEEAESTIKTLLDKMLGSESYGTRRGSAYGLAGVIKGLGILSLKRYGVLTKLEEGLRDKNEYKRREGALMGLELLCSFLGKLFEPYVIHILPHLLQCLGFVREATENTAKVVMSHLSGHGVKLVLPTLTSALNDEESWRTKVGAVELLGRMAYCAPRQLSGCLPMIVPKLIEVFLGDSHNKVQEAAAKALQLIGSVIQNPEVLNLVPVLLEALQDPGKKAGFVYSQFVHVVDPPSLALIMPVVERAFGDRSTENRKLAAKIIGNMYALTDSGDLAPYLESVMPGIKGACWILLVVAAKALRAMAKGMGEERCYLELLPWLMSTLVSEGSAVNRSGAAQGLAEVVEAPEDQEGELPSHVRDGYMMIFIYLPGVLEESVFGEWIGRIISPILRALADETEFVKQSALLAAQRIITGFSGKAVSLLLPELEKKFDPNWRIRHASVQLLGDLLFKISGVSGKMSTESSKNDDDNFGTEQSGKLIKAALGLERRNRVLSALYMGRSDIALLVRVASLHVWKVVVANTPKTLREILPTLFSLRMVAERTLKDLVKKLGEKILVEVIPLLEKGLGEKALATEREGVCRGLCEIMDNCSRDTILGLLDSLIPSLKKGLCDTDSKVRKAAAKAFATLHSAVGSKAVEEIVPFLLKRVGNSGNEGDLALDALGQLLLVKEKAVMPQIVPQLTAQPVNTKALAFLAEMAGDAVSNHLGKILPSLLEVVEQDLENCSRIILTVEKELAVRNLIEDLLETEGNLRRGAVQLLSVFCINSKVDLEPHVVTLLRGLIYLMTETDEKLLGFVAEALEAVVKKLEDKLSQVALVREAVGEVSKGKGRNYILPGLCLPKKGISPLLPIYREGILKGGTDLKEEATLGIGELVKLSSETALKPSVLQITGPLIRILGDRYGPALKWAVLHTLTALLKKVGMALKPFAPQLQTTFLKSANVLSEVWAVRMKAAEGLGQLVKIHGKPDPIFVEILNSLKNCEGVKHDATDILLYTLRSLVENGGGKVEEATRRSVLAATYPHLSGGERTSRVAAGTVGALIGWLPEPDFLAAMNLILADDKDILQRVARTSAMVVALKLAPARLYAEDGENKFKEQILQTVLNILSAENAALVSNGIRACAHIFTFCIKNDVDLPSILIQPFAKTVNSSSNEVKNLVAQAANVVAKDIMPATLPKEVARYLIPALVNGTKEKDPGVRGASESALISILQLKEGDEGCSLTFGRGGRSNLNDVVVNKLRLNLCLEVEGNEPDIDDTLHVFY
ncbi:Translational activator GCN1, partial [Orchesella cincta]